MVPLLLVTSPVTAPGLVIAKEYVVEPTELLNVMGGSTDPEQTEFTVECVTTGSAFTVTAALPALPPPAAQLLTVQMIAGCFDQISSFTPSLK